MITPEQLYAEAKKLFAEASSEADYRAIIERAYYAAYHSANEFEISLPQRSTRSPQRVGEHEGLIQKLEHPNPALDYGLGVISSDIGTQLRMLRPLRKLATYDISLTVNITDVETALAAAKDILDECRKAKQKLARPAS